jgi:putative mRNA 3-end processing factor
MSLLEFKPAGIYCEAGDFYIDPWKPVKKAIITHAHSDHARWGMRSYFAHKDSVAVLKYRLGEEIQVEGWVFNKVHSFNGVNVSLHPAGHIIGSAQVKVEYKGEIWVVSGDYKTGKDNVSVEFEPVKCHTFITESTFGLPVYQWKDQSEVFTEINNWWRENQSRGRASILCGYSLGKAQRLLQNTDHSIGNIYSHGAIENINTVLRNSGFPLKPSQKVTSEIPKDELQKSLILAPPSAIQSPWIQRFYPYSSAFASGWMLIRGNRRRSALDRGFALSDHAGWNELNDVIKETGAENIYVTHGYTQVFSQWLREQGYWSEPVKTAFKGEVVEAEELTSGKAEEEK